MPERPSDTRHCTLTIPVSPALTGYQTKDFMQRGKAAIPLRLNLIVPLLYMTGYFEDQEERFFLVLARNRTSRLTFPLSSLNWSLR